MRIEILGVKPFVVSAHIGHTAAGLHLTVNLKERWGPAHTQGGSFRYVPPAGEEHRRYDSVIFRDPTLETEDAQAEHESEVVVICESDQEERWLQRCVRYQCQEKEQFSLLYVPCSVLGTEQALASHRTA